MREIINFLQKIAGEADSVGVNIVIEGETGTGKEVAMRSFLDSLPAERVKKSIVINCSAFQDSLIESELFGYEKGAFTGAQSVKRGMMEVAKSWLVLDEVTSMSKEFQAKMLRAIESKRFYRVGGTTEIEHDLRFIALTNVPLSKAVKDGKFREDLMYRLGGIIVSIPPLRERKPEILSLFEEFCGKQISREVSLMLTEHVWPGNVRELKNAASRARILSNMENSKRVEVRHVKIVGGTDIADKFKGVVMQNDYKRTAVEKALSISTATFYRCLQSYGLTEWWKNAHSI